MTKREPEEFAHLEWLGYVQPVGLVVSIPAMLEAQCYVNKNIAADHSSFLTCLHQANDEAQPELRELSEFTEKVLGWQATDLIEVPQQGALTGDLAPLEVILPQYHETLRPTHAVPVFKPTEGQNPWMVLVQDLPVGTDLDEPSDADSAKHWNASPQAKFERLLRETDVPIGLLFNHRSLRLVYAPKGESSGYATFNVGEMMQVAGRPMFAALHMLLCAERMFTLADHQRLPAILENSRKYQNTVSTKLAEQVLAALYEMMRGFQAANDVRQGELLRDVLAADPNHVYSGLLTVLMRLVFVLYAEDRNLLSSDPIYSNNYSVTGLFNRLREDAGRFPDTMNQRYGAWSQLITLFRLVYEGGQHGEFRLQGRKGYLFDPQRYPFLEGRLQDVDSTAAAVPRVSDGVVYQVLRNLLILDGERLSYRTLDVEQIGSVYETVMGFNLEVAGGQSIAIKAAKTHGAPATINLEEFLAAAGKGRAKLLKELTDQTLGKDAADLLETATSIEHLLEALEKKIDRRVTPRVVPEGALILQPSDERRRSGSHYTPRSLTEPIVRTTLEPILKQLWDPEAELPTLYSPSREDKLRYTKGELETRLRQSERAIELAKLAREKGSPHPAQILDLKICDPAMGSGAFLVETCRQLGDELIKGWYAHNAVPTDIPPDEDEVLFARRLVAQRCLYGVDKNDMAVDLAKLSLWLVTLAKDHPFTFLDHALRHGDSLVGLTRRQIIGFHWEPKKQKQFGEDLIQKRLDRATEARAKILNAREDVPYRDQEQRLAVADEALNVVRLTGDACVSAFFAGSKKKREDRCEELFMSVSDWYARGHDIGERGPIAAAAASLRGGEHPIPPFHWEIEFPEVFSRENSGFDAFVGNPPFIARTGLYEGTKEGYLEWLKFCHADSHGNADLVAHFFRRTYLLLRTTGTFGLIATNTIGQGDSRRTGLEWILTKGGGTIFGARRRMKWPGLAAVTVSVVHCIRGPFHGTVVLDNQTASRISAFLFPTGGDCSPRTLSPSMGICGLGAILRGQGFLFDDSSDLSHPTSLMHSLIESDAKNKEVIYPYFTVNEIVNVLDNRPQQFTIYFGEMSEGEAREWGEVFRLVEASVLPSRLSSSAKSMTKGLKEAFWKYQYFPDEVHAAIQQGAFAYTTPQTSKHRIFVDAERDYIFDKQVCVLALDDPSGFTIVQSRVHECWSLFFGSSLEDRPIYTLNDCFRAFPFPLDNGGDLTQKLGSIGQEYLEFRKEKAHQHQLGLTQIYNRFHDPHEMSPDILRLRELHAAMDRAVLEAYGWGDLAAVARCEFLLDYDEEDDDEPGAKKAKRKMPWRLRWPDDFRDEVLARLLELNEQRHQEEVLAGKAVTTLTAVDESDGPEATTTDPRDEDQLELYDE